MTENAVYGAVSSFASMQHPTESAAAFVNWMAARQSLNDSMKVMSALRYDRCLRYRSI